MEINITKINLNPNAGAGGGGTPIVLQKKPLPVGIVLSGSTWETFDMNDYNFAYNTNAKDLFRECTNLTELTVSHIKPSSCSYFLHGCEKLETAKGFEGWDTSMVKDMSYMFSNCSNLTSLDLSSWDTSKVTNMSCIFNNCSNLTSLNVAGWIVTKLPNTIHLFSNCTNLKSLDLSSWDLSNVTSMGYMFQNCSSLEEIKMGGEITSSYNTDMFKDVKDGGKFYYPKEYDYTEIISVLPESWTAIAY